MKYIIFFLCFSTISISASTQTIPPKIKTYVEDTGSVRPIIKDIVDQMVAYNRVDDRAISDDGNQSTQYKRYLQLVRQATTRELVQLTNHKSPIIRAYTFWALGKREYKSMIPDIIDKHLNDKESFTYVNGCMKETEQINTFYLQYLIHNSNYFKLSKKEKEKYNKLLIDMRK